MEAGNQEKKDEVDKIAETKFREAVLFRIQRDTSALTRPLKYKVGNDVLVPIPGKLPAMAKIINAKAGVYLTHHKIDEKRYEPVVIYEEEIKTMN